MLFCCCQFQQVVSQFFRDHSRLVAKWPLPFLVVPLLVTIALTTALIVRIDRLDETSKEDRLMLFLPEDVGAMKNLRTLKKLFPPKDPIRDTYDVFRRAFAFVIFEDLSPARNVLRNPVLEAAADLHKKIKNIRVDVAWLSASYNQLCARKNGACIEHPVIVLLNGSDPLSVVQFFLKYPSFTIGNQTVDNTQIFGSVVVNSDGFLTSAEAMRIPYLLHESEIYEEKVLVYLWQKEFLNLMSTVHYPNISIHYISSVSWAEEVDRNGKMLLPYLPVLFGTLIIFSVSACFTSDCVLSKPWLGICGVVNAIFAVLAAMGTLIYCGYPFLQMVFIMPFLIISISVDNMFLMLSSWRTTHPLQAVEERMSHAVGDTAVSIMITALTDGLSFSVGSISQFPAVSSASCFYRVFCSGGYHNAGNRRIPTKIETQLLTEFLSTSYAELLNHWAVKGLILMFYVVYLGVAIYGIVHLPLGLNLRSLVPRDSYAAEEFETSTKHFTSYGSYAYAVIQEANLHYEDRDVNARLQNLYFSLTHTEYTTEGEFWLKDLNLHIQHAIFPNRYVFMDQLHEFLKIPKYRKYRNDLYFNDEGIETSKMLIRMRHIGFENQTKIAKRLRTIFSSANFQGFIYEPSFLLVDQQISTLHNILQNTGIAVGVMLVIAILFIPKLITVLWIGLSILSINAGVAGGLAFWGARLDIISMITIVMSVGFSVDFAAHITYHFLINRGEDRVNKALRYVGTPILLSAASTVLGVLSLAPADSYMVRTFVKTVVLVVGLGLLHGIVFLPVILSIFVPADQYLEALKEIYSHYLATNIPRYLGQIGNKRMRAYFNPTTEEGGTSEESLPDIHRTPTIQQHMKTYPHTLTTQTHNTSLPQIRPDRATRTISALYDFLKYKAELMNEEPAEVDRQEEIYSEICDRGCDPDGCHHESRPQRLATTHRVSPATDRTALTEAHLNSLKDMDVHNFRNKRPPLGNSVFRRQDVRESVRSAGAPTQLAPVGSARCCSAEDAHMLRRKSERNSNRMYLKRNENPRQSSSNLHHFPPPPREVQFFRANNKLAPPAPAGETVEIVLGSQLGSRSALQKSVSVENLSRDSLPESDSFEVFQRTRSGKFTRKNLSMAALSDMTTFKAASTVTTEFVPANRARCTDNEGDQLVLY